MNSNNKLWRYATVVVVLLILVNPEMLQLALFIDVIGLEIFLMLVEVQVLALMGAFLSNRINTIVSGVKHLLGGSAVLLSLEKLRKGAASLLVSVSFEATLMHLLVISAVVSGAFGVWH